MKQGELLRPVAALGKAVQKGTSAAHVDVWALAAYGIDGSRGQSRNGKKNSCDYDKELRTNCRITRILSVWSARSDRTKSDSTT
jgi:hypothetical protein